MHAAGKQQYAFLMGPTRPPKGCAHRQAGGNGIFGSCAPPSLGIYGAYPAPNPGFTFVRTKVNRKSASPLWAGPRLLSNRTPAKEHCAVTEFLFLPLVPRNRCGGIPTSPVGPRDDRHFWSRETKRWLYPFKRATAEAGRNTRQRSDTRRTCWFSGTALSQSDRDRLDKRRGAGVSPAVFPPTFGRPKVGPGSGGGAPADKPPGPGRVGPIKRSGGAQPP